MRFAIFGAFETRFEKKYGEVTEFFSRLSNLERKRWIAEEVYLRKELGLKTLDDYTFKKL